MLIVSNRTAEAPNNEGDAKLSVILESTREYVSSSSGSGTYTRTAGLTFALTREDMVPIKEQSVDTSMILSLSLITLIVFVEFINRLSKVIFNNTLLNLIFTSSRI